MRMVQYMGDTVEISRVEMDAVLGTKYLMSVAIGDDALD